MASFETAIAQFKSKLASKPEDQIGCCGQDARLTCWAWDPDVGDRQRLLLVLLSFRGTAGAHAAVGGGSGKAAVRSVLPVA